MKNSFWYSFFKMLLGPLFLFWYPAKIYNKENLKVDGPVVIAGNHKHIYDQCFTVIYYKRMIRYMAKKEYFDSKKTKWFFKLIGAIPVDRSKKDENAVNAALETLNNGGSVGIFPEGTRNKTDEFLLPFKFGAVSMAKKTGATIIPVGLTGDYKFRSKTLKVNYGTPFKVDDMTLEEANDKLYKEIEKLMKENLKK